MKKGIMFDLDGTLWDSSKQVVIAWNEVLARYPEYDKQITVQDMQGFMGKTMETIMQLIMPEVETTERLRILKECCAAEQKYLEENGAVLYDRLQSVLEELHKKYSLYIISNSQDGYVQSFLNYYDMWNYFDDIEMAGRTGKDKGTNIQLVMERNGIDKGIYVGDTQGDLDAADKAGVTFIHAAYGFGKTNRIVNKIDKFADIVNKAEEIFVN